MNRISLWSFTAVFLLMTVAVQAHPSAKPSARIRSQQVTPDQIQQALLEYIRSHKEEAIADVQVQLLEPEETITVPWGALRMRVAPSGSAEEYGRRQFDVTLSVNGSAVRTASASADVTALIDVAVPTRSIRPDETIEAEDVTLARTPMAVLGRQYATNLDEVIGKRAIRSLAVQSPISKSALAQPYLVRKGDRVTIEAKRKGLSIQTIGIMKAVGQAGQMVTVTNQDSGKDLRAKVVGPGVVRVEF
jgi:flagella basal body P-ring formation protein FlgA